MKHKKENTRDKFVDINNNTDQYPSQNSNYGN